MNSIIDRSVGTDRQRSKYVNRQSIYRYVSMGNSYAVFRGRTEFSEMRVISLALRISSLEILLDSFPSDLARTFVALSLGDAVATKSKPVAIGFDDKSLGGIDRDKIFERNTGSTKIDHYAGTLFMVLNQREADSQ
ncbi:hypothetical protein KOR42_44700 [Thalassoglobus neptunius]|uniref:Uncharacterized protein n=1 Tax=Thalassoglobus neptunius TaxID=1938619 RepID=A0A5C5W0E0_9PLAN|nr:hypothetical protein [Thalassoglobus neptunius]TWT43529.1 hypothetical protein KOR42_44700 [Thalassoglobus neptunius]